MNHHHPFSTSLLAVAGSLFSWATVDVSKVASFIASFLTAVYMVIQIARALRKPGGGGPVACMVPLFLILGVGFLLGGCAHNGSIRYKTPSGTIDVQQSDNAKGPGYLQIEPMQKGNVAGPVKVTASTGDNFDVSTVTAMFGAFRVYHFAAIFCALAGALILSFSPVPNRWGWILLGLAAVLSLWAHIVPTYGGYIAIVLGLAGGGGLLYYAFHKGFWQPNPALTDEARRQQTFPFFRVQ